MSNITFREFLDYCTITDLQGNPQPLSEEQKDRTEELYKMMTSLKDVQSVCIRKRRVGLGLSLNHVKEYLESQGIIVKIIK